MNVNKMDFLHLLFNGLFLMCNIYYLYIYHKVFVVGGPVNSEPLAQRSTEETL